MSFEVGAAVAVVLIVFAALLAVLKFMKGRGLSFTVRVFSALGMGIVLGVAIQLALGRGSDAAKCALDWMSLVGTGYISLLKMLVMPLIFVAIVGAFTRTEATENLGKIGISVLVVLLGTVAIAAVFGWATIALSGLAGADFTQGTRRRWTRCRRALIRWQVPRSRRPSCRLSRRTSSPTWRAPARHRPLPWSSSRLLWDLLI